MVSCRKTRIHAAAFIIRCRSGLASSNAKVAARKRTKSGRHSPTYACYGRGQARARARASTHESHAPGQTHILPTTGQTTVYWDLEKRPRLPRGDGRFLERWLHLQPFVAAFSDICSNLNFELDSKFFDAIAVRIVSIRSLHRTLESFDK